MITLTDFINFPAGFGQASHPALIAAGVTTATISLMDQESLPSSDIPAYSQVKYIIIIIKYLIPH